MFWSGGRKRRAHHVAEERNTVENRGHGDVDMVETTEIHGRDPFSR